MSTEEWPQRDPSLCHSYSIMMKGAHHLVSLVFVIALATTLAAHF